MSTNKDFLCLLLVAVCYGIAGRMDYEDTMLLDEAHRHPAPAVDTDCRAAIPSVADSTGREFVDHGDNPTDASPLRRRVRPAPCNPT